MATASGNRASGNISDAEKAGVWKGYQDRRPTRVPLRWDTNPRVILLNPDLNPEGYTFEQYFKDPRVTLLRYVTPEACAIRTKEILQSGIMDGGRFIHQEANNVPPCCPLENLDAVYETCLEYGVYR